MRRLTKAFLVLPLITSTLAFGDDRVIIHEDHHRDRPVVVPAPAYAVPGNLQIKASSREDRYLADRIVHEAVAEGALRPGDPPINLSVKNGRVHWHGRIVSSSQHRALIGITRATRGVRDIQDELRGV
jgi:hypothetical protein